MLKKVIIVDDSAFMRKLLTDLFTDTPDFTVVDTAKNGFEAIAKIKTNKPDLVTLDIEMPVMNGLDALKTIMRDTPVPIVVVSSLTREGSEETVKALLFGAVDFVTKNITDIAQVKNTVLTTCRNALNVNMEELRRKPSLAQPISMPNSSGKVKDKIIVLGTSTGGPKALQEIIPKLPDNLPSAVVVVQHMPAGFTKSLANRLNDLSAVKVKEAENNEQVVKGTVYIAPGDFHIKFYKKEEDVFIKLTKDPPVGSHRPAVNPMFESAASIYGENCVAVLLTGMGQDGAAGMATIKSQNGYTIAEDQKTAIVYGMPKVAIEMGIVDKVSLLQEIANDIIKAVV